MLGLCLSLAIAAQSAGVASTPILAGECAVVDVSKTTATLYEAQQQARTAAASAPCVNVLLGDRTFRLGPDPFVLSAADSHTIWQGGDITTALDVPGRAWEPGTAADGTAAEASDSEGVSAHHNLDISQFFNSTEWGKMGGEMGGIYLPGHLSVLVQTRGVWRPMRVARWPNVDFEYGSTPPVNWTTVDSTCICPKGSCCSSGCASASCGVGCDFTGFWHYFFLTK